MVRLMGFLKLVGGLAIGFGIFALVNLASDGLFKLRGLDEPAYIIAEDDDTEDAAPAEEMSFEELLASADPQSGERIFRECQACHRVEEGVHMVGPSLYNVVGRTIGAVSDFNYSDAFAGLDGAWTPEKIDAFITAPRDYAPGTAMTYAGLDDAEDRADVIAYLETLGN